jgi:thioredoxin-related protein
MSMTHAARRTQKAGRFIRAAGHTALALFLSAAAAVAHAEARWLNDYPKALARAEESGQPVLVVFTGSDWCQHCRTLERNVLETETFLTWAEGRVVLLMIDLPQAGISLEERKIRSKLCVRYGVRSFPNTVLVAPDGSKITAQAGYHGQTASTYVAGLDGHLPARALAAAGHSPVHASLNDAVQTARGSKRPVLVMVSRKDDASATTRVASLMQDPEFESLARENFEVAQVPAGLGQEASAEDLAVEELLGGAELAADALEIVVTDDGRTPLFTEPVVGGEPREVVSGLRRFLATRQAGRSARR